MIEPTQNFIFIKIFIILKPGCGNEDKPIEGKLPRNKEIYKNIGE